MKQYLDDLELILEQGKERGDRTGTGTKQVFGIQTHYNLQDGFPAMTTKRLAFKSVLSELLWFLEGSGDERRLCEILHGTRDIEKKTIWTDNAEAGYWKHKAKFQGDLGEVYGVQWRRWKKYTQLSRNEGDGIVACRIEEVDQIANLIDGLNTDPFGRRHILTAWNPGEIDRMALPPCHMMAQFNVTVDGRLDCLMYQRSNDFFLGGSFNIASYSLLTHMIAQVCGLEVGTFTHSVGDAHIYLNHMDQVKEQLTREPFELPTLWMNPDIKNIDDFTMDDFKLENYNFHPAIKAPMAV